MTDIPEGSGDLELALAMEEQVNARVLTVLERILGLSPTRFSRHADNLDDVRDVFLDALQSRMEDRARERETHLQAQLSVMHTQMREREAAVIIHEMEKQKAEHSQGFASSRKPKKKSLLERIVL